MNANEKQAVERIRNRYVEKQTTELDALRELDKKVNRPANIFSYVFGGISAIIMGAGMSLVMTEIGATLGMENTMISGISIGIIGMIMALLNYPIYKAILGRRKKKYSAEIIELSDKITNSEEK